MPLFFPALFVIACIPEPESCLPRGEQPRQIHPDLQTYHNGHTLWRDGRVSCATAKKESKLYRSA